MKLLLDPYIFNVQKFGGISRLYSEMLRILKTRKEVSIECPLYYSDNFHILHYKLSRNRYLNFFDNKLVTRLKQRFLHANISSIINTLNKNEIDVFIPTYYDTYFLTHLGDTPFVLTVYDMIHELFPQFFRSEAELIDKKRILIERSKKIIAISQNTKNDILKIYPHIPEEKIEIVYLSHSIDIHNVTALPSYLKEKKYLLFVGNRDFYKNFKLFIRIAGDWLLKNNVSLVCLGGNSFSDEESQSIDQCGLKELVYQYSFQDNELASFYINALAFVFPSEYEGFGIPVLEAMACSCPVILPKMSSFPEVAGDAGIYFDLNQPDSLLNSLNSVIYDVDFRRNKIHMGLEQVKKFSWEKTVTESLKVYSSV